MFIETTFNTHYMFNIIVQTIHILHFYQLYIWNKSLATFTYISNFVFHMIHIKQAYKFPMINVQIFSRV